MRQYPATTVSIEAASIKVDYVAPCVNVGEGSSNRLGGFMWPYSAGWVLHWEISALGSAGVAYPYCSLQVAFET